MYCLSAVGLHRAAAHGEMFVQGYTHFLHTNEAPLL